MMPSDFAIFILTHGRPRNQKTLSLLNRRGYTGKIYFIIDDEDKTADEYKALYGDRVVQFSKKEVAETIDTCDNSGDLRAVVFARNACFDIAKKLGINCFMQMDDDYGAVSWLFDEQLIIHRQRFWSFDGALISMRKWLMNSNLHCLAWLQGGDLMGGELNPMLKDVRIKRKAMNTMMCLTDRRVVYTGKTNEDVNAYVLGGIRGELFMSLNHIAIIQEQTQAADGGLTDIYKAEGTYVKSFYTVMQAPSCAKIHQLGHVNPRIHHRISPENCYVKIISTEHRKRGNERQATR